MGDDEYDNDDYQNQDDNDCSKSSLNKYFNKSYSTRTFINANNTIKLGNGLKLNIDSSVNSNHKYKGKYNLYFDWHEKDMKFKLKFNDSLDYHNFDLSVRHKGKYENRFIDNYSAYYSVDIHQKLIAEFSFSKKFQYNKIDCKVQPKIELQNGKVKHMVSSKIVYNIPQYKGLSNKISLKLKKLVPQITINNSFNIQQYKTKIHLDTKFDSNLSLNKTQLQIQYNDFTAIIQKQKSSSLYVHYQLYPYSIGGRIRQPDQKNWWQIALNRRVSSKKLIQLSIDNKRWALLLKHNLNQHTHFYLKFYNEYSKKIFKNIKNNLQIGFRFND